MNIQKWIECGGRMYRIYREDVNRYKELTYKDRYNITNKDTMNVQII